MQNILGGDDRVNAFEGQRGGCIDSNDSPVRNGAAANFSVEHPGKAQVVNVFRGAGYFGVAFQTRDRASHLAPGRCLALFLGWRFHRRVDGFCKSRGHGYSTPVGRVRQACSNARRTCTRTISRL